MTTLVHILYFKIGVEMLKPPHTHTHTQHTHTHTHTHTSKINSVCFFNAYLNFIQKLDQTVIARPPVALSLAYMLFSTF